MDTRLGSNLDKVKNLTRPVLCSLLDVDLGRGTLARSSIALDIRVRKSRLTRRSVTMASSCALRSGMPNAMGSNKLRPTTPTRARPINSLRAETSPSGPLAREASSRRPGDLALSLPRRPDRRPRTRRPSSTAGPGSPRRCARGSWRWSRPVMGQRRIRPAIDSSHRSSGAGPPEDQATAPLTTANRRARHVGGPRMTRGRDRPAATTRPRRRRRPAMPIPIGRKCRAAWDLLGHGGGGPLRGRRRHPPATRLETAMLHRLGSSA
jgi:hypothetical protein